MLSCVDGGAGTVGEGVPTTMNKLSQNKITYFTIHLNEIKTKESSLICIPPTHNLIINYCVKVHLVFCCLKIDEFLKTN